MKNMTLSNIAKACNGIYYGSEKDFNKIISGVEKDSRLIEEGYLYLPFVGNVVDGHDFIPQVFERGALCTLSEKKLEHPDGPYIFVDSVADALKSIAEFYREQLDTTIIGITGSVGKTSTKEIIASVLEQRYCVLKTEGNYNNEIGMPLTILKIREKHQVAVVEMGISDFGEMHRLSKIAKPDICVITNIGTCHLENLGDRDGVFKAKSEIFDYIKRDGKIILNGDDDKLAAIHEIFGIKPVFFGMETDRKAKAVQIETLGLEGTKVKIAYDKETFETVIPIPGFHMVLNALAATCIGRELGLSLEEIDWGIRSLKAVGGRNNIIKNNNMIIIDDCYNANPMSMKASIDVLKGAVGRRVAILGDMFELGEEEVALHREVGEYAAMAGIELIICVGKLSENMAVGAKKRAGNDCKILYFKTKEDLEKKLYGILEKGDNILIKASNGMKFKTIVEKLSSNL